MTTAKYSRKWKVYVVQNVHGMLGWARSYEAAQSYYDIEVLNNLDLMDQSDGYDVIDRHRFAFDCVWIIRKFLERHPEEATRVRRRMLERRLELSAYEASVTDLCLSGEEFIRCLSARTPLERQGYGTTALAVHTDVHSYSLGFPSLAAGSGLRYLAVGTNGNPRCGFPRYPKPEVLPRGRALFWWEGIDGQRLLCFHYGGYYEASGVWNGGEFDPDQLAEYLGHFEAMGDAYPYDAVVMLGTGGDGIRDDGFHQTLEGTRRIRTWNREQGGSDPENLNAPLLINGPAESFFEYVEANFAAEVPVFKGGWGGGDWLWDTQSQRFGKTGLQARQSSARLQMAEPLSTISATLLGTDYPGQAIDDIYTYRIWHDEHDTNGTRPHVSDEIKEEWRTIQQQWGTKNLERPSTHLLERALAVLAANVPGRSGQDMVVYNPLSNTRTDVVRWPCPMPASGQAWLVRDPEEDTVIPSQYVTEDDTGYLLFVAHDMPPLGYRLYSVELGEAAQAEVSHKTDNNTIENELYRVTCGPDGSIAGIWDKQADREIVRPGASFNRYVNTGSTATAAQVSVENDGPVACNLLVHVTGLPQNTQELTSRIWLYPGLDRVEIVNTFSIAEEIQDVYFDFPMDLGGPSTFTLEGPAATILIAGQDEFDEAKLEHWNTFSFVDVSSGEYGVTFFSPDTRQVYLGGRIQGAEMPHSDLTNDQIVVRVIGGGPLDQDWIDPNGGPVDNPYTYRFSLRGHQGPLDVTQAVDGGWAAMLPPQTVAVSNDEGRASLPAHASIWQVPSPLFVSAFKVADEGSDREVILRLWNPTDHTVQSAEVQSDILEVSRARGNDHAEHDTGPEFPTWGHGFSIDVAPHTLRTIRVWLSD